MHWFTDSRVLSIAITRATSGRRETRSRSLRSAEWVVQDYAKDSDIGDPSPLTDTEQTLLIDQTKYFNFYVDSIDRAQQNVNVLDTAMREAAHSLREQADTFVAGIMDGAVLAGNKIGTTAAPIVPTKDNAYEYLVDLGVLLDEGNNPDRRALLYRSSVVSRLAAKGRPVSSAPVRRQATTAWQMVRSARPPDFAS